MRPLYIIQEEEDDELAYLKWEEERERKMEALAGAAGPSTSTSASTSGQTSGTFLKTWLEAHGQKTEVDTSEEEEETSKEGVGDDDEDEEDDDAFPPGWPREKIKSLEEWSLRLLRKTEVLAKQINPDS